MRRILVCTGVLGGGTALVFALAAATALLFPQGTLVSSGGNPMMERGWVGGDVALPVPAPMVIDVDPQVDARGDGGIVIPDGFEALPGDIVVTDDANGVELAPAP